MIGKLNIDIPPGHFIEGERQKVSTVSHSLQSGEVCVRL